MKPTPRLSLGLILLLAASGVSRPTFAESKGLPRSSPERQGVSSAAILDFVKAADSKLDSLHSVMIVRHGHVVAEGWWTPYNPQDRHEMYSLSKSFTSTAVGLAVAEGKLKLSDSVLEAFKSEAPASPEANLKAMRLRDLLRMSAGHQKESPVGTAMTTKSFLEHPVPFKPGTHFLYNTPATFMASAMVQKATGETVLDYLKPRLFDPLGIENPTWDKNSQGISLGGYGLSIRTEDIAKFGQLYLQKGKWNGKQLLPESWVAEATSIQTSNGSNPTSDWEQGYGYQFWRARHGAYRGDGAMGQYCIVIPKQDTVIAITSGVRDMQAVLNLLWDNLLPGLKPEALPENPDALKQLGEKLAGLSLKVPAGSASSPKLEEIVGKTYVFPKNDKLIESITLNQPMLAGRHQIVIRVDGKDQTIEVDTSQWTTGEFAPAKMPVRKISTIGAWTSDDTLAVRMAWVETPFVFTLKLRFEGDQLFYDVESTVRPKDPQLVGKKS